MGYYTDFEVKIVNADKFGLNELKLIEHDFKERFPFLAEWDYDVFGGNAKWYDYHEDMIEFSSQHPKALFSVRGCGESPEDIWKNYYMNGKSQTNVIEVIENPLDISCFDDICQAKHVQEDVR